MIKMRDDERCAHMVMSGGRRYVGHRCAKRALTDDPDQLCRTHRLERDGHGQLDSEAESRLLANRDTEGRLVELARHLEDFFSLRVDLEYEEVPEGQLCTGRLVIEPGDLLAVIRAQDLMPRRAS